ncbi:MULTISPECIES: hypothetical protein [Micromonospora]|jgi:hypothetical protein|uniref:DUF5709 domain-containing protein n=1 Tax=Micromonospora sicca TaxID=2202420 RepID=A0A317DNZ4_9ACTN|nr:MULTISPECIES: hypothetical protein [unclassified Micromonospora]MBM0224154.1 hypothetical protein [Micromonospora sp. ATA51]MDZ5441576.1 hypothetical protein [Micromonospora sp. 4G57]MDZ5489973.1 hypothetical protein [Micromonospora sp. 4G53]PWR14645.1 hypothetical protein DKT69_15415 [Micromonospora sp. 4G51]
MTIGRDDNPLELPPEADAVEQRQPLVDDGQPDETPAAQPESATEADLVEQGESVIGEHRLPATTLPADANAADALEQRQLVEPIDEDRRE